MFDPTVALAFFVGLSVGEAFGLLAAAGRPNEAKAIKEALQAFLASQKRRRTSTRK